MGKSLFVTAFLLASASVAVADDDLPPLNVVCFGDSTTAPRGTLKVYSDLLNGQRTASGRVVQTTNSGIPGDHTNRARQRFEKDVTAHQPDVVIIQFGINDAAVDVWRDPPATEPRVSREAYRENLRFFIHQLQQ
ncbi:MAG: SGNH/GDSL hydrolase family protein, partial [Planctomycetaceae bacterium]|nr:SGNH/GDSL hydrolase family protein [Planctomycetaceae bacterium]